MISKYVTFFLISFASLSAAPSMYPIPYPDQRIIYEQGGQILLSSKENEAIFFQTSPNLQNRKGNFFFSIQNRTPFPIDLLPHHVSVSDQWGRPVRILSRSSQLKKKRKEARGKLLINWLRTSYELENTKQAGNFECVEQTKRQSKHTSFRPHKHSSENWQEETVTRKSYHSYALQREAEERALLRGECEKKAIYQEHANWKEKINANYFDATTIFPSESYGANLQIEVPKSLQRDLEFLIFTFHIGNEVHHFAIHCTRR